MTFHAEIEIGKSNSETKPKRENQRLLAMNSLLECRFYRLRNQNRIENSHFKQFIRKFFYFLFIYEKYCMTHWQWKLSCTSFLAIARNHRTERSN